MPGNEGYENEGIAPARHQKCKVRFFIDKDIWNLPSSGKVSDSTRWGHQKRLSAKIFSQRASSFTSWMEAESREALLPSPAGSDAIPFKSKELPMINKDIPKHLFKAETLHFLLMLLDIEDCCSEASEKCFKEQAVYICVRSRAEFVI